MQRVCKLIAIPLIIMLYACSGENPPDEQDIVFREPDLSLLSTAKTLEGTSIDLMAPAEWEAFTDQEFHVEQLLKSQPSVQFLRMYKSADGEDQLIAGAYQVSADSVRSWMEVSAEALRLREPDSNVVFDVFRHNDLRMANLLFVGRDAVVMIIMAENPSTNSKPAMLAFLMSFEAYREQLHLVESVLSTLKPS